MGHTVWSQRIVLDHLLGELSSYGKALRREEREVLEQLLKAPLRFVGAQSYANSLHAWAFLLLAILIEQQKQIDYLRGWQENNKKDGGR